MAVQWTEHRFAGGVLALDVANTVVLRNDPDRSFDRFDDPAEIARFASVASVVRADELQGRGLTIPDATAIKPEIARLRETTDALFRDAVQHDRLDGGRLSALLGACASALEGAGEFPLDGRGGAASVRLDAAVAISALGLLQAERLSRLRICRNCAWLFLDRSRNGSRIWCDMAVCGNRRKAARHYRRRRQMETGDE